MADPRVTVTLTGLDDLRRALAKTQVAGIQATGRALYELAENLMTEAKRLVPVDTGNLRASGHVVRPQLQGTTLTVTLGFGGPAGSGNQGETNTQDVGYALPVHENLTARHVTGGAKYLERPVTAALRTIEQDLARRVRTILGEQNLRV